MTSLGPINGVGLSIDAYAYPGALSGDALLAYCQSQLKSLDTTVQGYLEQQQLNVKRKKALAEVENVMKKYPNVPNGPEQWDDFDRAFDKALASLPAGDPARAELQAKADALNARQGNFTKEEWAAEIGSIGAMLAEVTGNAEINMIHLQTIMSQRQTAVQLTTGMLAKYDDGLKSIVGNIGR